MLLADVAISSSYDPRIVSLSIAIAVLAAYTALDLAGRVTLATSWARTAWLIGGAIVMGIGIWSMHFVAMLALSLPVEMTYDIVTVLLSILPAIIASAGALFLASRPSLSFWQLIMGGILMGIGIASMHYIGMYAMQIEANTTYNPLLVAVSIAIAISASIVSLNVAFQLRTQSSRSAALTTIVGALIMGLAIAGMHYTGMAAVKFTATNSKAISTGAMKHSLTWLAVTIGIATFVILGFALLTSFVDRRLTAQVKLLEKQEAEARRSQLFTEITLQIRRSLKSEDVLYTTVKEIRQALKSDRVVIYRFHPDWSGTIVAESVADGWIKAIGKTVYDPFRQDYLERYTNGEVRATDNVREAGYINCHCQILEDFQIKANLVAPIIINNQLISILCVHQCSGPRHWQQFEIDLVKHLAIQVAIALEQASLLNEFQQSQKVLRLRDRAIAASSNGIIITDARAIDNPIIFSNPAFETITGYSPEEAIGRNCRFLQGPESDPASIEQLRHAVRNSLECQVVIKNYRKNGTPYWSELTISPVRDSFGQVTNYIGVQADITLRKQAEEELRLSQQALQSQLLQLLTNVKDASQGDLTVGAENIVGEVGVVADVFNTIIYNLRQIVNQVKLAASQVNLSLDENSGVIQQLANKTFTQSQEINYTLEEVDKINFFIQTVADDARQVSEFTYTASDTATTAQVALDNTVQSIFNLQQIVIKNVNKVKRLGESSQQISFVMSLIKQIVLQTNLLAINANIEAAWVGKEGRGFTIVAEQIGKLAAQSQEAMKEVQQMLEDIEMETSEVVKNIETGTGEVLEGANMIKDAKHNLGKILELSRQIDDLAQSIKEATVFQAENSSAIASLMQNLAAASEETANSSYFVCKSLQQTQQVTMLLEDSVNAFKTDA
ncbi:MAG: PAS domain-containing protein [Hassallia sp. WJT32-NPBG1]|jgi:methyl-accepting chemotaxis protein PixJ|nr:PAS domain-containing protein [Hassallia sp. WJT32-NPBG1]